MEDINLEKYPVSSGVYIWKRKNKVLYVGKAKNLRKRLSQYFRTGIGVWKEQMVSKADNIEYILTSNEQEALILEEKLIKKYLPAYNCLLKGDNAYVYIRIQKQEFPKIEFTRYKDKNGIYIGPKPWKKDLKNIFMILRKVLKFRTCSDTKFRQGKLCSDFTLGLCAGWCYYKTEDYKNEYKKNINIIKNFFNGNIEPIRKIIKEKIEGAIKKENFEYAQILKEIYFKLDKISENQAIEFDKSINGYFIKIRKYNNFYFMIYSKFINGKLIDIVKLKDNEDNFLENMIKDGIIKEYKEISNNFYYGY